MQPLINFWCILTYQLFFVFSIICYGTSEKTLFEYQASTLVGGRFLFKIRILYLTHSLKTG